MARLASLIAAAALVSSAAAAQYAPYPQPYPQPYSPAYPPAYGQPVPAYPYNYPGQPYDQGAIGAIIDNLIGNRYNVSDRQAIRSCAFAAVQRAQSGFGGYGGGYNNYVRVTAITDVERRSTGLRVRGMLGGGGRYGNQGYGYGGAYGRADLGFRCDVDYRGYVRNLRLEPLARAY
jgi:hypothetical protein